MNPFRVFLRTLLCAALPLCLLCSGLTVAAYSGSAPQTKTTGANLRVMSYNVRVDNDESIDGWSWGEALGNRGNLAAACIDYYKPDVIGLQECNYKWHVSLRQNLPDYDFVNPDVPEVQALEKKESLGKKDWMCTTLMYNTKTLTLLKNELIGYSVNYWGCIQRMRYVSMALFQIKATGQKFVFISTHLDAEKEAKGQNNRLIQAGELAAAIQRYKDTYGCPVISTGDYNSGYSDPPIQKVVADAGMRASEGNRGGIDYILYSQGVESKYFTVIGDADVLGASDHKPVMADLAVSDQTFPTTRSTAATTTGTSLPYYTTTPTTYGSVFNKNTTTTTDTEDVTTTPSAENGSTAATNTPTSTAEGQDEDTTTPSTKKDASDEKESEAVAKKSLPDWFWIVIGAIGLVIVASVVVIVLAVVTGKN